MVFRQDFLLLLSQPMSPTSYPHIDVGVSINLGSSISPPVGSYLATQHSTDMMFFGSSLLAVISMLMLIWLKETLAVPQSFHPRFLLLKRNEVISANSILPALVCGLSYMGFGVLITITPDQCVHLGMANKGLFFTSFTICSVLSRLVAGTISDRFGRIPVMKVAVVLLSISYFIFGLAHSPETLLLASGFVGFSLGIVIPAVFAWTVDRSEDAERGKSLATLFIDLELAIGMGAIIGAEIYANDHNNFKSAFIFTAAVTMLAFLFVREGEMKGSSRW